MYKENSKMRTNEMNQAEYDKIFTSLGKIPLWLNFSGGEPFLKKDIEDIVSLSLEKCPNVGLINIPTNGLLSSKIQKSVEHILGNTKRNLDFFVTISLDDIGKKNDNIRGIGNSYKRAQKTFSYLKEVSRRDERLKVGFQTTLSRYNIDNVEKIIDTLGKDISIFTFSHESEYFQNIGKGEGFDQIEKKILIKKSILIANEYRIQNFKSIIPKIYLKLSKQYFQNPKKMVIPCSAGISTLTIDPYGNVFPCSYYQKEIGNLRENGYDINSIFNSIEMSNILKKIKNNQCPVCWSNCEAYPSIFLSFPNAIIKSFF